MALTAMYVPEEVSWSLRWTLCFVVQHLSSILSAAINNSVKMISAEYSSNDGKN